MSLKVLPRLAPFLQLLRTSQAVRQSGVLLISQALTAGLLAASFLMASRVLGPELFGVFSVFTALVAVWMKVPDLGMNQAIISVLGSGGGTGQDQQKIWLILEWKWWASIGLLLGGALVLPFLPQLLRYSSETLITLSLLGGVFLGWFETMYTFLLGRHRFVSGGVLSVLQAIGKFVAFGVILFFIHGNIAAESVLYNLGLWYVLLPALCASLFVKSFWRWLESLPNSGGSETRRSLLPLLRHTAVGTIALTLLQNIDVVLVQTRFNAYDTGLYAGASRLALFVGLLTYSLSGVLNNRASRYRDRVNLGSYLKKSLSVVVLAVLCFCIFLPLRKWGIELSIGAEYLPAEPALVLLMANAFLSLAIVPFIAIFYGQNKPSYFSIGGVLQLAALLGVYLTFAPFWGIMAMAWARLVATVLFGIYTLWSLYRLEVWKQSEVRVSHPEIVPS